MQTLALVVAILLYVLCRSLRVKKLYSVGLAVCGALGVVLLLGISHFPSDWTRALHALAVFGGVSLIGATLAATLDSVIVRPTPRDDGKVPGANCKVPDESESKAVLSTLRGIAESGQVLLVFGGEPVRITESVSHASSVELNLGFAIGVDVFGMTELGDYVGIRQRDSRVVLHHHDGGDEEVLCDDATAFARAVGEHGFFRAESN